MDKVRQKLVLVMADYCSVFYIYNNFPATLKTTEIASVCQEDMIAYIIGFLLQ